MAFINTNFIQGRCRVEVYQALGNREEQQDAYVVSRVDAGILLAVADGHIGKKCANTISAHLANIFHEELENRLKKSPLPSYQGTPDNVIQQAVRVTISRLVDKVSNEITGSTLTMAFVEQGASKENNYNPLYRITVGQMGDSVFALSKGPKQLSIAPRHTLAASVKDVSEIKAFYLERYGKPPKVTDSHLYSSSSGTGGLAFTRSLGDRNYLLVRKPQVKTYFAEIDQSVLLLATDGIVPSGGNDRASIKSCVDHIRQGKALHDIYESLPDKDDNVTIIGVRL